MGKRETLLDRSQRLLGRALGKASDSEGETKKPPPAVGRRDQVLQAQRTHRHRTQQYIRELEKEVIRFHETETELVARIKHLDECLLTYRHTMWQHNIQPPPLQEFVPSSSPPAAMCDDSRNQGGMSPTIDAVSSPSNDSTTSPNDSTTTNSTLIASRTAGEIPKKTLPTVSVNLTTVRDSLVKMYNRNPAYVNEPPPVIVQADSQRQQQVAADNEFKNGSGHDRNDIAPQFDAMNVKDASGSVTPTAQMSTQLAIDFVLKLEQPCLAHIHEHYLQTHPPRSPSPLFTPQGNATDIDDDELSQGVVSQHLLNLSAPLYTHCRAQTEDPLAQPMTVDSDQIERLLLTSLNLRLGGEVTPVQIWAMVKDISRRHFVSMEMLDCIVRELASHAYCNSFGTVVRQNVVDEILGRIIEQGNVYTGSVQR